MSLIRRITAAVSALAVSTTSIVTFSVAVAATTFTDASSIASWASASVTSLVDSGVLSGRPDGSFDPQGQLNRAEMAKVAMLATGLTEDTTGAPHFNDVASGDWFYPFVETLYNNGVVGGVNGGALDSNGLATYNPGGMLNRAEGSKILVDAFDLETSYSGTPPNFPDVSASAWYYDFVETAYAHGILNGYDNGNFGPADAITREQVAVIAQASVEESADSSKRRSDYTAGPASDYEGGENPPPPHSDGTLTVAKSSSMPAAATFPVGASSTAVAAYNFTATGDTVTITNVVVKRTGVGTDNDWTLYLYDGTDRLTSGKTVNSTSHEANFTGLNVKVAAGTTKTLTVKADTATGSTGGDSYFEISSAEKVVSNAKSVAGSFPIKSNKQEINTNVVAGGITIEKTGSISNPKVGEDSVTIAKFKLTTATEAGLVKQIALIIDGTISATDVQNAKLYQGDTLLASASSVNSKDLFVFTFATPFTIEKGDSRNFEVKADLNTGRNADTVKVYLDEATDLVATGGTYGFGMSVTYGNYDNGTSGGADDSECTLQGGDITISSSGPTASDVAINAKDVVLMDFSIVSVSEATFKKFGISLTTDDADNAGGDQGGLLGGTAGTTSNYTDIKIVNKDTGAVLMGPIDADVLHTASGGTTPIAKGTDGDGFYTFTDEFTMAAGESLNLALTCDVANNSAADFTGDAVYASLDLNEPAVLEIKDINNKTITNSTSVVPSSDIDGKTMTIAAASLTVTEASTPVSDTFVKGTKDVEILGLSAAAGSASDVKITEMVVRLYADTDTTFIHGEGDTSANDVVNNLELWVGKVKIAGPKGMTLVGTIGQDGGYYKATFDNMSYVLKAGSTEKIVVKGDISSSLNAVYYIAADINPHDDITAEDDDGNTVTAGANAVLQNNATAITPTLTLSASGTLTVAEENSPNAGIVIAGAQGVAFGQYKFTATNEAQTVKDFTVEVTGAEEVTDVVVEYKDKEGTTVTSTATVAGGNASFKDETLYVAKDGNATLSIKGNLNTTAAGAGSGDSVKLTLGTNAITSFKAVGEGSGVTTTTLTPSGDTNTMILRKTAPTIAKATGLSTSLVTGTNTLYGFTVAADAAGAISWKSVKIKLTGNIAADGTLNDFKFYEGSTDKSDDVSIRVITKTTGPATVVVGDSMEGTAEDLSDSTAINVVLAVEWNDAATSKETISAGNSSTYYLKANVAGIATNDSLTASIEDDSSSGGTVAVVPAGLAAFALDRIKYIATAAGETNATDLIYDVNDDTAAADGTVCTGIADDIVLGIGGTRTDCGEVASATQARIRYVTQTAADAIIYDPAGNTTVGSDGNPCGGTVSDDIRLYGTANDCEAIAAVNTAKIVLMSDAGTVDNLAYDVTGNTVAINGAVCTLATDDLVLGGTAAVDCQGVANTTGVSTDLGFNFTWSDQSNTAHATTTADWTSGWLVDSLATESATLQK